MTRSISKSSRRLRLGLMVASLSGLAALGAGLILAGSSAAASPATVGLGTAGNFAVLAHSAITDVPTSSITGDVGVSPLTSNGLSCPEVTGTIYSVDASGPAPCRVTNPGLLTTATADDTTAYNDAAGRTPFTTLAGGDNQLGGQTLVGGVYRFGSATTANLSGTLTLSGSASDVWIFQASSDLILATGANVVLTGGASACNVFWQVDSSATLNSGSNISGTILALTSITAGSGATISGRLLAQTGDVTLDDNTVNLSGCGSGGSSSVPAPQPPGRALYCSPSGQSYDLVQGQDTQPPYAALGLVPATIDPVTGSASCSASATATTTTTAATTTTTTAATTTTATVPPPPPATTTAKPKPAPPAHKATGVKAAKHTSVTHVAPQPAKHTGGFTG
jgi:hypothetical protein